MLINSDKKQLHINVHRISLISFKGSIQLWSIEIRSPKINNCLDMNWNVKVMETKPTLISIFQYKIFHRIIFRENINTY